MEQVKHTAGDVAVHTAGCLLWIGSVDNPDLSVTTVEAARRPRPRSPTAQEIADAQRLARCWNSHDVLVAAAKRALAVLKAQGESVRPGNALGALEAALAKAEGRTP